MPEGRQPVRLRPDPGLLLSALAGVLLFLLLFRGWFGLEEAAPVSEGAVGVGLGRSFDAWVSFAWIDLFLLAVAAVAVGFAVMAFAGTRLWFRAGPVLVGLGAISFLLIAYRLAIPPWEGADREAAPWLGLLCSLAISGGGCLSCLITSGRIRVRRSPRTPTAPAAPVAGTVDSLPVVNANRDSYADSNADPKSTSGSSFAAGRVHAGEWLVGLGGLTVLAGLTMSWSGGVSAVDSFSLLKLVALLLGLGATAIPVVAGASTKTDLVIVWETFVSTVAVLGVVLLLLRLVLVPEDGLDSGFFTVLGGSLLMIVSGWLSVAREI